MKLFATQFIIVFLFFLTVNVSAQRDGSPSCEKAYRNALDLYYAGRYESVHSELRKCVEDFGPTSDYYKNYRQVFRVYKLIITSYYNMDYDYRAQEEKDFLIEYFRDWFNANEVVDQLRRTKI